MSPELSVVIPLYNHGSFIEAALDSVAKQDIKLEIILVDDMSTDNGLELARSWAKNSSIPFTIIENKEKQFALHSRIIGAEAANSEHVLFMDADDTWIGENRLKKALAQKIVNNCDILHFSSRYRSAEGVEEGELSWTRPFAYSPLYGEEVFKGYLSRKFLPIILWDKILSKSLILEVLPHVKKFKTRKLDDKIFTSYIMLYAKSYLGSAECAYHHKFSGLWHMEKYAEFTFAVGELWDNIAPLLEEKKVDDESKNKMRSFCKWRCAFNCGKMCERFGEKFLEGEKIENILSCFDDYIAADYLYVFAYFSFRENVLRINEKYALLNDEFVQVQSIDSNTDIQYCLNICLDALEKCRKASTIEDKKDMQKRIAHYANNLLVGLEAKGLAPDLEQILKNRSIPELEKYASTEDLTLIFIMGNISLIRLFKRLFFVY